VEPEVLSSSLRGGTTFSPQKRRMSDLDRMRLAIAGAGVFGLCVALRAAMAGAQVEVFDPVASSENGSQNASAVAAGMIAPVGEVLFDPDGRAPLALLRAGRDGWGAFEKVAPGLTILRNGVQLFWPNAQASSFESRLDALGVEVTRLPAPDPHRQRMFTTEDWLITPTPALTALRRAIFARAGRFISAPLTLGDLNRYDAVVIAAGWESASFAGLAPELGVLQPIKGQLVRFPGAPLDGPILRCADVYVAPQAGGALAGATMEPGRSDQRIDPVAVDRIAALAAALEPALVGMRTSPAAGVRASTPDGLPLAGPSSRPGLWMATGARRNGWLLAPLVSQILVSYLSGGDGGPFARALDPRRFARVKD
jgi:glycine oxidase